MGTVTDICEWRDNKSKTFRLYGELSVNSTEIPDIVIKTAPERFIRMRIIRYEACTISTFSCHNEDESIEFTYIGEGEWKKIT